MARNAAVANFIVRRIAVPRSWYIPKCHKAGEGNDAKPLDEPERTRLRTQALGWLREDLAGWDKRLDDGKATERSNVESWMRKWLGRSWVYGTCVAAAPRASKPACWPTCRPCVA